MRFQQIRNGTELAPSRTGLSLLLIATAQLMLVLDDSIANIALPSIQNDLRVSSANLLWVVNAYILVFGGLLLAVGPIGAFYLLTLYMQHLLGYSSIQTGMAWLPFSIGLVFAAGITSKLAHRYTPRVVGMPGMLICGAAMLWLSAIEPVAHYAGHIMPAIFAMAFGFGMGFIPLTLTATSDVRAQESVIASALLNASQQIGTAFGLAVLSTISIAASDRQLPDALRQLYAGRPPGTTCW